MSPTATFRHPFDFGMLSAAVIAMLYTVVAFTVTFKILNFLLFLFSYLPITLALNPLAVSLYLRYRRIEASEWFEKYMRGAGFAVLLCFLTEGYCSRHRFDHPGQLMWSAPLLPDLIL